MVLFWKRKQSKWFINKNGFSHEAIERKKIWWEEPNFLRKHDIKLNSHENFSIEFENFGITETPTLFVLNQRENYGIDKIIDINKFSIFKKLYWTSTSVKQCCVNLKNTVNNRKEIILLKLFLKSSELCQAENDWIKINRLKITINWRI